MRCLILPNACVLLLRFPVYDQDYSSPQRLSNFPKITELNRGKRGSDPIQAPPFTVTVDSPQERRPRKIAQPALKVSSRPCPQKVPYRAFEFLLLLLQSISSSEAPHRRIRHSNFQEGRGADRDHPRAAIEREQGREGLAVESPWANGKPCLHLYQRPPPSPPWGAKVFFVCL